MRAGDTAMSAAHPRFPETGGARRSAGPPRGRRLGRRGAALALLLAPVLLAAPVAAAAPDWQQDLERAVRDRGLDSERLVFPGRVTEEMRRWVHSQVGRGGPEVDRAALLLERMLSPGGLGFQYDQGSTGTAREVFESGRGNCLGFTQLFVALARELGVPAYFVRVGEVVRFHREDDLILVSGHVTAGYQHGPERRALEFTVGAQVDYRYARPLSDLTALALFYSNRGAEALRSGDPTDAIEWLETAIALEPALASALVNLGVARRRLGDLHAAEAAYRQAIEVDGDSLSAYHNLAILLRLRGETDAARQLLRLLDRRNNRNPYTYLALGDSSVRRGELEEAMRYYRRAVRLGRGLAEARAAMGDLALKSGDPERARGWLEKAQRIDPEEPRTVRLREGLAELAAEG